jgi:glycosyltransferase involved in cell wall biosynthesis
MSEELRINLIFTKPNMSGGMKSCRLLAEAMQRQGADVVIYHPTEATIRPRLKQRIKNLIRNNIGVGDMNHHLEHCEVPVVPVTGRVIGPNNVRDADFQIANFWVQRNWLQGWPAEKGVPSLYVRGHAVNEYSTEEKLRDAYQLGGVHLTHANWLKAKLMKEYGCEHVILAPNGIDREQFSYQPRKFENRKTIGFQYASDPRKGAACMFKAVEIMRKKFPGYKLISYGSVDVADNHKHIDGWRHEVRPSYSRIADIYREADVWVIPSLSEGLPMPGLESSAVGTPVVATLCGGPEDYISEGKSGYLIDIEDHEALADRLEKICNFDAESWLAFSKLSYENSLKFDWDVSAKTVIEMLTNYRQAQNSGSLKINWK